MANPTQIISALSYRDYKSHNRIQNNHLNPDNIGTLHSLYIHLLNINQENHMEPDNIGKPDIVDKHDIIGKHGIIGEPDIVGKFDVIGKHDIIGNPDKNGNTNINITPDIFSLNLNHTNFTTPGSDKTIQQPQVNADTPDSYYLIKNNQEIKVKPDNVGNPDKIGKPDNIDKSDIFSNLNYTILIYRQSRYYRQTCRANSLLHHI